jgi:hypothetical protein
MTSAKNPIKPGVASDFDPAEKPLNFLELAIAVLPRFTSP